MEEGKGTFDRVMTGRCKGNEGMVKESLWTGKEKVKGRQKELKE